MSATNINDVLSSIIYKAGRKIMGIFDWMTKDTESTSEPEREQALNNIVSPEDEDAKKRKLAFERLTRGENPIKDEPPKYSSATTNESAQGSQDVSVFNIKTNQDLDVVVDYINRGEPVIANLGKVPKNEQQRVQDFLSGVVFALNANISLLVQDMYLITPVGIVVKSR